jgi:hypothetical protein
MRDCIGFVFELCMNWAGANGREWERMGENRREWERMGENRREWDRN